MAPALRLSVWVYFITSLILHFHFFHSFSKFLLVRKGVFLPFELIKSLGKQTFSKYQFLFD